MNMITLLGNVTRDPQIRYTQGENSFEMAYFDLAVSRPFAKEGETNADFFHCVAFRKQAEVVEKYFRQGSRMLLVGRVQNNNYTNKKGEKVYSIQVVAEKIEFAERKSTAEKNAPPSDKNVNRDSDKDFSVLPEETDLPFMQDIM